MEKLVTQWQELVNELQACKLSGETKLPEPLHLAMMDFSFEFNSEFTAIETIKDLVEASKKANLIDVGPDCDKSRTSQVNENPFEDDTKVLSFTKSSASLYSLASNLTDEDNIFNDLNEIEDTWLEENLDPFSTTEYQSSVLNPILLLDFESPSQVEDRITMDPALGKSWAQSVDKTILQSTTSEERKRQEAIFELISTENAYVSKLQTVLQVFYNPLRQQNIIRSSDLASIFINIESILVCHVKILSDFEELQRRDKLFIQNIGRTVLKHVSILNSDVKEEFTFLEYLEYCSNQMAANKLLVSITSSNQAFASFLKLAKSDPRCKGLDLSAFLLEPMQRITRYPLLLKQIVHYTEKGHQDQPALLEALRLTETLLNMINMAAKESESRSRLVELNEAILWRNPNNANESVELDLMSDTRYLGPRILLHNGVLFKAKSGRKLHAFLCNDLLLLTSSTREQGKIFRLYREPLLLEEINIQPKNEDDLQFSLEYGEDYSNIIAFRAPDSKTKKTWISQLDSASKQVKAADKHSNTLSTHKLETCIGTLSVLIIAATQLRISDSQKTEHINTQAGVYARIEVDLQIGKTSLRPISSDMIVRWNQPMLFSVQSLDSMFKVTVYCTDRYSKDEIIGSSYMQLDFLEYYGDRDTERINMSLTRGKLDVGTIVVKMNYKPHLFNSFNKSLLLCSKNGN